MQEDHGVQVQALQAVPRSICSLLKVSLPTPAFRDMTSLGHTWGPLLTLTGHLAYAVPYAVNAVSG